ncbi:hypothetical protein CsSME_00011351 [Camellia sinensis var. sinensis]
MTELLLSWTDLWRILLANLNEQIMRTGLTAKLSRPNWTRALTKCTAPGLAKPQLGPNMLGPILAQPLLWSKAEL